MMQFSEILSVEVVSTPALNSGSSKTSKQMQVQHQQETIAVLNSSGDDAPNSGVFGCPFP